MATGKILILVTNVPEYQKVGYRTGLWLGELTHFWDYAEEQGFELEIASPSGGFVPIDPESLAAPVLADLGAGDRYIDRDFMKLLDDTKSIADVKVEDYDAIYFTGGHGVMFDFIGDDLGALTAKFAESGRIVSTVCHGGCALVNVPLSNGEPLVKGRNITGFSWPEEVLADRGDAVPFNLEEKLKELGANYSIAATPFDSYVVTDGKLITGQNPGSARAVAEAVVAELKKDAA